MRPMPTFERTTLSNGIRVLTAPMSHAQSVSCFLFYAAGSRYETKETNGIAHFAEHMFFKGTERRPTARDIAGEIDAIGGEFNAFTGKEYTGYYVRCAAETRDTALDVLVDMLRNSRFDADEIERENPSKPSRRPLCSVSCARGATRFRRARSCRARRCRRTHRC
jgi:predicted Zn-dependent peptidase